MFFYVSKLVWLLAVPSTLLTLLAVIGGALALLGVRRRSSAALALTAAAALLLIGLGPVGSWALLPLENRFPPYRDEGAPVAGIVVLGGGIYPEISAGRGQLSLGEANERLIALADLARRHPEARLVFTGGSGALAPERLSEAETVRRFGGVLGFDTSRVTYEGESRTTWENALYTRRMVAPGSGERWLLVTSARHMPRAVGCFRAVGFGVEPFPVDYLTQGDEDAWGGQPAVAVGLQRFDEAMREWAGLLAYRIAGRTRALYPGPSSGPEIR